MTSLSPAPRTDVDQLAELLADEPAVAPGSRGRRVAALSAAVAVCLAAVGGGSLLWGDRTTDAPSAEVLTTDLLAATPSAAGLQVAAPASTAQAPASRTTAWRCPTRAVGDPAPSRAPARYVDQVT